MIYDESTFPTQCVICKSELQEHGSRCLDTTVNGLRYPCLRCDTFRISFANDALLHEELTDDEGRTTVSHHVRRLLRRQSDPPPLLTIDMIRQMQDRGLPDPDQQADNLILLLGRRTRPGHVFTVTDNAVPIIGCWDWKGLYWLADNLHRADVIRVEPRESLETRVKAGIF